MNNTVNSLFLFILQETWLHCTEKKVFSFWGLLWPPLRDEIHYHSRFCSDAGIDNVTHVYTPREYKKLLLNNEAYWAEQGSSQAGLKMA